MSDIVEIIPDVLCILLNHERGDGIPACYDVVLAATDDQEWYRILLDLRRGTIFDLERFGREIEFRSETVPVPSSSGPMNYELRYVRLSDHDIVVIKLVN